MEKVLISMSPTTEFAANPRITLNYDDICFLVDTSNSTFAIIDAVKELVDILEFALFLEEKRIALVRFCDAQPNQAPHFGTWSTLTGDYIYPVGNLSYAAAEVVVNFTNSFGLYSRALTSLEEGGGGDTAEKAFSGMMLASRGLLWRALPGRRLVILITDAPPKDPEDFSLVPGEPFVFDYTTAGYPDQPDTGLTVSDVETEFIENDLTLLVLCEDTPTNFAALLAWQALMEAATPSLTGTLLGFSDASGDEFARLILKFLGFAPRNPALVSEHIMTLEETVAVPVLPFVDRTHVAVPRNPPAEDETNLFDTFTGATETENLLFIDGEQSWRTHATASAYRDGNLATLLPIAGLFPGLVTVDDCVGLYVPYYSPPPSGYVYYGVNAVATLNITLNAAEQAALDESIASTPFFSGPMGEYGHWTRDMEVSATVPVDPLVPGTFSMQMWGVRSRVAAQGFWSSEFDNTHTNTAATLINDNVFYPPEMSYQFVIWKDNTGSYATLRGLVYYTLWDIATVAISDIVAGTSLFMSTTGGLGAPYITCAVNDSIVITADASAIFTPAWSAGVVTTDIRDAPAGNTGGILLEANANSEWTPDLNGLHKIDDFHWRSIL